MFQISDSIAKGKTEYVNWLDAFCSYNILSVGVDESDTQKVVQKHKLIRDGQYEGCNFTKP